MCQIINFDSYRPARPEPATKAPFIGSIDTFDAGNGKVGIDACLSAATARKLAWHRLAPFPVYVIQCEVGGNIAFEWHTSPVDAERLVRRAKRAGVTVN